MIRFFVTLLVGLFLLTGCVPQKRYQSLEDQQKRLQTQLARERNEFSELQGIRAALDIQLQQQTKQLTQANQERERLAALTRQYNALATEHNQLADNYTRLKTLYDSTQRETTAVIADLESRLESVTRAARNTTRSTKSKSAPRRRRRR